MAGNRNDISGKAPLVCWVHPCSSICSAQELPPRCTPWLNGTCSPNRCFNAKTITVSGFTCWPATFSLKHCLQINALVFTSRQITQIRFLLRAMSMGMQSMQEDWSKRCKEDSELGAGVAGTIGDLEKRKIMLHCYRGDWAITLNYWSTPYFNSRSE